ncbi:MAG: polysaccharide biosynthesis tyrosine autokinase [Pseudomonadota bacterium]
MSKKRSRRHASETFSNLFLGEYPSKSRFAEAYRTLRTNIHFSFLDRDFHSLLVTSAGEREGKTVTVANLGYTMAQAGKSVLMIDADLRKPFLSSLTHTDHPPGLTGLLTGLFGTGVKGGSLQELGVGDLYRLLSLQKRTGLLRLTDGKEELELFFLHGEMKDLNWATRPEERKLATVLVKNRLITGDQAKQAVMRQKGTGQKLGFILINTGLLKKEDLTGPLTIHMMEGLRTALQLKEGKFSFTDLPESDLQGASFDPVDFDQIYRQVVVGEEEIPYLQEKISSAVLNSEVPNLNLLPAGSLPPNPSELLGSARMSFLLSILKKRFDVLVIDSPPILPASDALLLAPLVDGVVFMVKAGLVNREMVNKAVEQLRLAKANILGVVLNQVDIKREGYYKYYHKYYSKYYGESA